MQLLLKKKHMIDHITLYDETSVTYIKTEKIILISVVRINYESFK